MVLGALPGWAQSSTDNITIISPSGRDTLETLEHDEQTMVALDDLARVFRFDVREDSRGGTLSVSVNGAVIILTPDQQLVSVDGRLVSLRAAPRRVGDRWVVPLDFLNRALAPVYDEPVELRPRSGLLMIGDVVVPEVSARYRARRDGGVLSMEVTPSVSHTIEQHDDRLVITFAADGIDVVRRPRLRGDYATGFEPSRSPPGIVVTLGPAFDSYRVSTEPAPNEGTTLSIDLSAATTTTDVAPGTAPAPPPVSPTPTPTGPLPDFATGSTVRVVAIDAGHGGDDIGSQGTEGALEKDITLSVARRLRNVIENRLGLRVILTRGRDDNVGLDARAAIANNNKADLFVSLHVNASARPSATGAEVFHLSIDEYGAEARALAEREVQPIPVIGGGNREIDMVLWEMAQIRYVDSSARLAEIVEQELGRRVPMSPRSVQQAPFRVLVGANMPAVLVELGSLSDPAEETRLTSAVFQNAVVEAIVASILRFRDVVERSAASGSNLPGSDGSATARQARQ